MAASLKSFIIAAVTGSIFVAGPALAGPAAPSAENPSIAASSHAEVQLTGSRKGARVKGYVERRGGYSYNQADSINTYGDSRSNYGNATSLRDPSLDKQSVAGPFDHGFFFDSATGPRGGDSPYMN
jgi:hypothetical protein